MRTKILLGLLLLSFTFCFVSCDEDTKEEETKIPENIDRSFSNKFSPLQTRQWSRVDNYYIATFTDTYNLNETAWFTTEGIWQMTKTDVPETQMLPYAVEYTFAHSEYAGNKITAICKIERLNMKGALYRISILKGEIRQNVYIQTDGILIRTLYGNNDQFRLIKVPEEVNAYMAEYYSQAPVLGILFNDEGHIEIYISHENNLKRVELSWDGYWFSTSWQMKDTEQLPEYVTDFIAQHYAGYSIRERRYEISNHGNYYCVRLITNDDDIIVSIRDDSQE